MGIDFNEIEEINMPGMNNGTGTRQYLCIRYCDCRRNKRIFYLCNGLKIHTNFHSLHR